MAVPPAAGDRPAALSHDRARSEPSDRTRSWRFPALVVMVLLIVAGLGVMTFVLVDRSGDAGSASAGDGERDEVMSTAYQFALRLNTYGPGDLDENNAMPQYVARVEELMTPKFASGFEQDVKIAEQTVAQAGVGRETKVYATAVSDLTEDDATVLVAGTFTNSYPNPDDPEDAEKRIIFDSQVFRYQVTLVRTDGDWLVDDFVTITDLAAGEEGDPSGLPTELGTGQPSAPSGGGGGGRQ